MNFCPKNAWFLIGLIALTACSDPKKTTHSAHADSSGMDTGAGQADTGVVRADEPKTSPAVSARAGTWTYQKIVDKTGDVVHKASITSPTVLTFGFPYTGPSTATLTLRKRSRATTVYMEVSQGHFNQSFQGGTAKIRFDGKPPVAYSYSAAANGRGNIIFFDAGPTLIDRLKTARKIVIEVGLDNQGQRQVEFRTAGLRWNH